MFYYEKPKVHDVFEYARRSLDERDVRQTHSLPLQAQFNREFAERMNLRIIDTFVDDASAKIPNNRPDFTRMLKELSYRTAARRRAEGILCWHPDRLARNGEEAGRLVQMVCDELIKDMFFPTYHFHNDPSGIEHLMMEFGRAISYSGWLSINSKRGCTGREQQGAWVYGRPKFGYTKKREVPETPKLCSLFPIPDEKTFPARQRLVELWKQRITDEECGRIIKREFGLTLKTSTVSDIRRDPFNYGVYVIKPGEKDERRIDFRTLKAPDGTPFTPVTDEKSYWSFQSFIRKAEPDRRKVRHLNPLQGLVTCAYCGKGMRPARRKIRRAGFTEDIELGYECHSVNRNKKRCRQCRVPAKLLYKSIEQEILEKMGTLNKRHYRQYQIGLKYFLKEKVQTTNHRRSQLTRRIKHLEKAKADVLEKKLAAVQRYQYDDDTRDWVKKRLAEIEPELAKLREQVSLMTADGKETVMNFRRFIELKENLHHYWHKADEAQKKKIAEVLLLNCEVKMREKRTVTWVAPMAKCEFVPKMGSGGPSRKIIEPYFENLWEAMLEGHREGLLSSLVKLSEQLGAELDAPMRLVEAVQS